MPSIFSASQNISLTQHWFYYALIFTNEVRPGQSFILCKHVPYTTFTSQVKLALTEMNMRWQTMCKYQHIQYMLMI